MRFFSPKMITESSLYWIIGIIIGIGVILGVAPRRLGAQENLIDSINASINSSSQVKFSKKLVCVKIIRSYNGLNLRQPSRVFCDTLRKEIYILDAGRHRILVYSQDFYPLLSISKLDGLSCPLGLTMDKKGYLFVLQGRDSRVPKPRISVFDPILRWKKAIYFTGFDGSKKFYPKHIAIGEKGNFYVAGSGIYGVLVLHRDGSFSHFLSPIDRLAEGEEHKVSICDVTVDQQGRIYLLSENMGRIYVYDKNEKFLFKFGQKGGGTGKLSRPRGLAVDDKNKIIYVVDYMRHVVNLYSLDGHFLLEFGGFGWEKGWFQYPSDVAVDANGDVLVADTFNNRVQVFRLQ
ncbi:MAG: NHL repeat-containing protein [Desulfonauticus sp.]|nr:NHL repeat-containing protein [Desulfonauticus sp.]